MLPLHFSTSFFSFFFPFIHSSFVCISSSVKIVVYRCMSSEKKWVGLIDDQDFFKKNDELKRPMSPHLTIYQPQLTSLLSITHRGTGIALTGLISLASIGTYLSGEPFSTHLTTLAVRCELRWAEPGVW